MFLNYITGRSDFCGMSLTYRLCARRHTNLSRSSGLTQGMPMLIIVQHSVEKRKKDLSPTFTSSGTMSSKRQNRVDMALGYQYLHDTAKR